MAQQSASQRVFATTELLELILNSLQPIKLLELQRVNPKFKATINTSPQLRSTLFFDSTSNFQPRFSNTLSGIQTSLGNILPYPLFFIEIRRSQSARPDETWNTMKGAPKFHFMVSERSDDPPPQARLLSVRPLLSTEDALPVLRVMFASKREAYAVLREELIGHSWQGMHLTSPALPTKTIVIFLCVETSTMGAESLSGEDGTSRVRKELKAVEITVHVGPSSLGRMLRLAAKIVANDEEAWDGTFDTNKWPPVDFYTTDEASMRHRRHFDRLVFGTHKDAEGGMAAEDPDAEGDRVISRVTSGSNFTKSHRGDMPVEYADVGTEGAVEEGLKRCYAHFGLRLRDLYGIYCYA